MIYIILSHAFTVINYIVLFNMQEIHCLTNAILLLLISGIEMFKFNLLFSKQHKEHSIYVYSVY